MKLSGFIMVVLIIGLAFAIIGSIVGDMEQAYPEIDVNTSWETGYNYTGDIEAAINPLKTQFEILGDEEEAWFPKKLVAIVAAIPAAIISIPAVIIVTMAHGVSIMSKAGSEVGIPPFVISIGIVALTIIIIFAIASFWHRSKA